MQPRLSGAILRTRVSAKIASIAVSDDSDLLHIATIQYITLHYITLQYIYITFLCTYHKLCNQVLPLLLLKLILIPCFILAKRESPGSADTVL